MKQKSISLRMILLAFLLVLFLCLCTACGSKKEKENPSGEYKLYSMETGGDSYTNEDIVSYGLDSMTMILYEDGTGQFGFGDEMDAFTWADGSINSGGDSLPFEFSDGMLIVSDDADTMTFQRIGDAPKKAEITGGTQDDMGENTASETDEMSETATE